MAIDAGWLANLLPTLPSIPHKRILLLTRTLNDELEADSQDTDTEYRTFQLYGQFDEFLGGESITVGGRLDDNAYMKQLEPPADEVWEIRSVNPKPSIRVFGRFAAPDVFVATNKALRTELGGFNSPEFRSAKTRCQREWNKCFHTWPCHTGVSVHDYISNNAVDVRDL